MNCCIRRMAFQVRADQFSTIGSMVLALQNPTTARKDKAKTAPVARGVETAAGIAGERFAVPLYSSLHLVTNPVEGVRPLAGTLPRPVYASAFATHGDLFSIYQSPRV